MRGKKNAPDLTINFPKLIRQRKWTAEKAGRLNLYITLWDITKHGQDFPYDAIDVCKQKIDMLDDYEKTQYFTIWEPLSDAMYKLQNNISATNYKFFTSISFLTESVPMIDAFNLLKNEKEIPTEKKEPVFKLMFIDPERIRRRNNFSIQDAIAALKARRAVNTMYEILADVYDEKILLLVSDMADYQKAITKYEKSRDRLITNNMRYYNMPASEILPPIDVTKTQIDKRITVEVKSKLRQPLYSEYAATGDLANIEFYLGDLIDGHARTQ